MGMSVSGAWVDVRGVGVSMKFHEPLRKPHTTNIRKALNRRCKQSVSTIAQWSHDWLLACSALHLSTARSIWLTIWLVDSWARDGMMECNELFYILKLPKRKKMADDRHSCNSLSEFVFKHCYLAVDADIKKAFILPRIRSYSSNYFDFVL